MADDTIAQIKQSMIDREVAFENFKGRVKELSRKRSALVEKMIKGEDLKKAEEIKRQITEDHHS